MPPHPTQSAPPMSEPAYRRHRRHLGLALGESLLYGVLGLVIAGAIMALMQASNAQQQAANAFQNWHQDAAGYEQVVTLQQRQKSPVMIYFYADWCPYCQRFKQNVLSSAAMQKFTSEYPHVGIAPDNGSTEKQLMADFGAEGYPSYYLQMPDGRRFKVETYTEDANPRPKTADEFIQSVRQAIQQAGTP